MLNVGGATTYDDPISSITYIIVFNESLYYGRELDHLLINLNQVRSYRIPLWDDPFDNFYNLSVCVNDNFEIPFTMNGTKIKCSLRFPTAEELENFTHMEIPIKSPWDHNSV